MIQLDQSNKNPILGQEKIIYQITNQEKQVQNVEGSKINQLIPYSPFQIQIRQHKKKDANQKIDRNRSKQIRAVLLISLCLFSMGFNRALIAATVNSQSTKQFQKLFNFHGNVVTIKALLSSMNPMGALCGTILCSFLIKQYSARQILLSTCIFGLICSMLVMINEITVLMIFRFLNGWTAGIFVALIPSFIRQITSKNLAPYLGTAPVVNQSLGGLVSFILGYAFFQSFGRFRQTWLLMSLINTFPLFVILIALKTDLIYQSPIYLLKNGDKQQALTIYQTIYQPKYVNTILKEKQLQIRRFYFKQFRLANSGQAQKSCFRRKDILIAVHLPTLRKMTGVIVIILSSGSMLKTINPKFQRVAPIFINLIFFVSCFFSNFVQRYMTRRASFQLGTVSICICNLILTLGFLFQISAVIVLVFQVILLVMYGMTLGPLVWPYLPQVVPYRIIPLAQSMNWIVDCVTLSLPGVLIAYNDSPWPLFFAFFLYDFISIFVNPFLIVETKQKTVEQIIEKLDENSSKKQ